MLACQNCNTFLLDSYAFCPGCTRTNPAQKTIKKNAIIINIDDNLSPSEASITSEVWQQKETQWLKDHSNGTPGASSAYGIDPKPVPIIENRSVKLWISIKGETLKKLLNDFKI